MKQPSSQQWDEFFCELEALKQLPSDQRRSALAQRQYRDSEQWLKSMLVTYLALAQCDADTPQPGDRLNDLTLRQRIGSGGMGVVFEADQHLQGATRRVAVKFLKPELCAIAGGLFRDSLDKEVQAQAPLQFAGISRLYATGTYFAPPENHEVPYLVMELIRGAVPLTRYVRDNALELHERLQLFRVVCNAIQHTHDHRVVHRDLKPDNILVSSDGNPWVIDFGLAQSCGALSPGGALLAAGTPSYMSPEQISTDFGEVTDRSDTYALGVLLYELVTDELPYHVEFDRSFEALRRTIVASVAPSTRKRGLMAACTSQVVDEMDAIIGAAMTKVPATRLTVRALANKVQCLLDAGVTHCQVPSPTGERSNDSDNGARDRRRTGALRLTVALGMLALVLGAWVQLSQNAPPAGDAPLPKADPNRLTVMVADLQGDEGGWFKKQIEVALQQKGLEVADKRLQVLPIRRTIPVFEGAAERTGHGTAQQFLLASDASVVIWGGIVGGSSDRQGTGKPLLFFSRRDAPAQGPNQYAVEDRVESYQLPGLFWEHFEAVLKLAVAAEHDRFWSLRGGSEFDYLQPYVAQVKRQLAANASNWSPQDLAITQAAVADALTRRAFTRFLNTIDTIHFSGHGSQLRTELQPLAFPQGNDALVSLPPATDLRAFLGEEGSEGTALLEEAAESAEAAVDLSVPGSAEWTVAQAELGDAFYRLGSITGDVASLRRGVEAYRRAFAHATPELSWRLSSKRRGDALLALGALEGDVALLEEAKIAFWEALEELHGLEPYVTPLVSAALQARLATVLLMLGQRESGTASLDDAVLRYQRAIAEIQSSGVRWNQNALLLHAQLERGLGAALLALGLRGPGNEFLEAALDAYERAVALYSDVASGSLFAVLTLEDMVNETPEASSPQVSMELAKTHKSIGDALLVLAQRDDRFETAESAVYASQQALAHCSPAEPSELRAQIQSSLAASLLVAAQHELGTDRLFKALAAFREARRYYTRDRAPLDWAATQAGSGSALRLLGEREHSIEWLQDAKVALEAAWDVYRAQQQLWHRNYFEEELGSLQRRIDELARSQPGRLEAPLD
ncbi:MAG: serine/threonine-protein kinase [Pseudomonadota bacterium]